ncbi:hypothetical protein SDC9_189167 [bioreactor metagenome]|uniref:Uncharacterized protein n=1 Tax=bioreactor metagenome TaxID=1076179 RepID=A0A645I293_9ZZZZ
MFLSQICIARVFFSVGLLFSKLLVMLISLFSTTVALNFNIVPLPENPFTFPRQVNP